MYDISVLDENGCRINTLVQWDKNVFIYIDEEDIDSAYNVHFFNDKKDEAYVVNSSYSNKVLSAKIPNELLTNCLTIFGYIYIEKNNCGKSIYNFKIPVRKRPRPSDYIYVQSDDYVSIMAVLSECKQWASSASTSAANAQGSATEAKSYAIGQTGTRENEEQDNARYYYNQSKDRAGFAKTSADEAKKANSDANVAASSASTSAANAQGSATEAKSYAEQVTKEKNEISDIISNSLLASSDAILESMKDYFNRAEALYRSCYLTCDGENPQKRVRTMIVIDCHTPQRRANGYKGVEFDGQSPSIRLVDTF